jgi:DNA modification methylase
MNRLTYNADCLSILPSIEDESIDGVFTDPPFNIDLNPQRKTHGTIANDALSEEDFRELIYQSTKHLFRVLRPNRVAWFCCNWLCANIFDSAAKQAGFTVANWVVWVKNVWGIGYHFRPQHEFIIVAFKGNPPVPPDGISNVWNVPRLQKTLHPTEKPIELVQKALLRYNHEGDTILDPFAGVFSTCVAAKKLNMDYIGIELLQEYYDIGIRRLESSICVAKNKKGTTVIRNEGDALFDFYG